jgi:hypothetical protein
LAGKITFGWVLKDITQAEHFSNEDGGNVYSGCDAKDFRANNGVLLAEIHHMDGVNPLTEYELMVDLIGPGMPVNLDTKK